MTRNSEEFTGGAWSLTPSPQPFSQEKRFNFSSSWFPVTCYGQFALPKGKEFYVCNLRTSFVSNR